MGSIRLSGSNRFQAIRFAFLGNVLPVAIATASRFSSHHPVFFIGALGTIVVPVIVTTVPRRYGAIRFVAAIAGLPALTLMQAFSGGAGSPYSILMMMAMVWFGLQATERELLAGAVVLLLCAYLPMLVVGPPAYPVDWGHATLLVLVGYTVAGSVRALTREMHQLARRLRHEALIDDLTGLLNRRGWREAAPRELARATRVPRPVSLLTLDLNQFKALNDELGHQEGDRILRETADRLKTTFRAGDIVARLGGDEFVALLTNSTLDGALSAIDRLRATTPPNADFSAGVAIWDGREDLSQLLHRSDRALYQAKASGGSATQVAGPFPVRAAAA